MILLILTTVVMLFWLGCERDIRRFKAKLSALQKNIDHTKYLLARAEIRNCRLHNRLAAVRAAVEISLHKDLHQ